MLTNLEPHRWEVYANNTRVVTCKSRSMAFNIADALVLGGYSQVSVKGV